MNDQMTARGEVAVIVPARNAASTIGACLAAIRRQTYPFTEIVVFDDGSSDETASIATDAGARVLRHAGPALGPAAGRNRAAATVEADFVLFVDADVVLAPDALFRLMTDAERAGAVAAFGSYDDHPVSRRASSLYANLRHHFVHQNGDRDAMTFWSGIGLVRSDAFRAAGGFDAGLYPRPSIEDIELGSRIIAGGGRIRLVPEAMGTHWKDWGLSHLWYADIVSRALPWARLIVDGRAASSTLNVAPAERVKALLAGSILISMVVGAIWPAALLAAMALSVGYGLANRAFFSLLARRSGAGGLAAGAVLHWCYHLYATASYVAIAAATRLGFRGRRRG